MGRLHSESIPGLAAIILALAGCAATTQIPRLPSGEISGMKEPSTRERSSFVVDARAIDVPVQYAPVGRCAYLEQSNAPSLPPREQISVAVRKVRDRLLVTIVESQGTSTALMASDGALYTFNLTDAEGHRRTPANNERLSAAKAAEYQKSYGPTAHMINNFSAVYPHYVKRGWAPGDVVATLEAEGGSHWANHVYRGTTNFQGRAVAVVDIVRTLESAPQYGPVVVGWTLVDTATMAPLLFTLDAGWTTRLERLSCDGQAK